MEQNPVTPFRRAAQGKPKTPPPGSGEEPWSLPALGRGTTNPSHQLASAAQPQTLPNLGGASTCFGRGKISWKITESTSISTVEMLTPSSSCCDPTSEAHLSDVSKVTVEKVLCFFGWNNLCSRVVPPYTATYDSDVPVQRTLVGFTPAHGAGTIDT